MKFPVLAQTVAFFMSYSERHTCRPFYTFIHGIGLSFITGYCCGRLGAHTAVSSKCGVRLHLPNCRDLYRLFHLLHCVFGPAGERECVRQVCLCGKPAYVLCFCRQWVCARDASFSAASVRRTSVFSSTDFANPEGRLDL